MLTTSGRGSQWASTCSWAAAGCRGAAACRCWWRGAPRCRSRCSRQCVRARRIRPRLAAPGRWLSAACQFSAFAQRADRASAQCRPGRGPHGHEGIERGCAAGLRAASPASPALNAPWRCAAVRSRIWSPMATPHAKRLGRCRRGGTRQRAGSGSGSRVSGGWPMQPSLQLSVGFVGAVTSVVITASAFDWRHTRLPSCIQAACLGAFLVRSHSLIMSHFTSSSAFIHGRAWRC